MIDEARQDQASLYVLRMLPPGEALAFAREMEQDPELQELVARLEDTASTVALAAPLRRPPTSLRSRILAAVRGEPVEAGGSSKGIMDWIPWTIAAGLALTAATFWYEARTSREGLAAVKAELALFRERIDEPPKLATPLAFVSFNPQKQQGQVKLFPKADNGKDYQLWIIDPATGKPVSAGILRPSEDGSVTFRPERPLPNADTFAISLEPAGGSEQPRGQVILQGKFLLSQ